MKWKIGLVALTSLAVAAPASAHGVGAVLSTAPLAGSGPAVSAGGPSGPLTVTQGRREIVGYEHDGKWIAGSAITNCRKIARNAVRCTVTTPPIRITTDPAEVPQVWSWVDTAKPNPGLPLWWNVVSSDPVGGIVLSRS